MSIQQQQQPMPIVLLREGTTETKGNQAQRNNITAAKTVAEIVRTSLGPRGMDKMLVNNIGDVTITNDGATILKEIDVQHPAAKMMVEISKATDNEVGDGTSSVVVLAGALIEESDELSQVVVNAALQVSEPKESGYSVDIDDVKVEKKAGGSLRDTKLIKGIVLDKEVVHGGMPKRVEKAKIALVNSALEIEKTEFDAKININSPDQMKMFLDEENRMLKSMVDK